MSNWRYWVLAPICIPLFILLTLAYCVGCVSVEWWKRAWHE